MKKYDSDQFCFSAEVAEDRLGSKSPGFWQYSFHLLGIKKGGTQGNGKRDNNLTYGEGQGRLRLYPELHKSSDRRQVDSPKL